MRVFAEVMSASEAAGTNFDIDFLSPSQRSCINIGKVYIILFAVANTLLSIVHRLNHVSRKLYIC